MLLGVFQSYRRERIDDLSPHLVSVGIVIAILGRSQEPGEMQALMRTCTQDDTPASARDAAIIGLAYGGGLRRAEIVSLDLAHVTDRRGRDSEAADDGETITLRILGKRNKERLVYLNNGPALALVDWLMVRGDEPGALFWSGRKGGHLIAASE